MLWSSLSPITFRDRDRGKVWLSYLEGTWAIHLAWPMQETAYLSTMAFECLLLFTKEEMGFLGLD